MTSDTSSGGEIWILGNGKAPVQGTTVIPPPSGPHPTLITSTKPTTLATSLRSSTVIVPPTSTAASPPTGGTLKKYDQCGGTGWSGSGTCVAGTTCTYSNEWYSQCL